jgi:DNA mismatch repair ATPase MutS
MVFLRRISYQLIAYLSTLNDIKKALEIILNKGETPSLPDNVKKIIEVLVAKIKEAKAVKKDPKKFKAIVKLIKNSFEALTLALGLINKELAEKLKQSKVYQFIEDFIDSLNDEEEEEIEETPEPKITEEEKKEFESTVKELETLFSAVGIKF